MYSCITVLGLGSLGGYVVNAISSIKTLKKIILVDYDRVEKKNLKNTIYKAGDIGNLKTDVLSNIICTKNKEIEIIKINDKFIEGKTKLPESDLVLDCRDFTYDRKSLVDARFYISSRYLIVDCRKDVKYEKHYEGEYTSLLTESDLKKAAFIILTLICDGIISSLITNKSVNKFDLDYLKQMKQRTNDVIYNYEPGEEKLINLRDNLFPILKLNKELDLDINMCLSDTMVPVKTIPKGILKSGSDVITNLIEVTNLPFLIFNTYIISVDKGDNRGTVTLIPETGAA